MDNEKNKSVRIRTQVGTDGKLDVHLQRDVDLMQILSLNLKQSDAYLNKSSNYGVIVGRVLANDAFGVENVKVSVFIPINEEYHIKRIRSLYPFRNVTNRNSINNTRYNLLEDKVDDDCHANIGTFPNKRLLLDDNTYIEVFDKYYKYTTTTNKSGDYMIYGVPIGSQQVHIDADLSNIGILSQKPRDFYYKGYGQELFKNANQFKTSTNLDNLAQVLSQNKSLSVYPFWGDEENDTIALTRCDINLDYKFESTCVFMGSAITDRGSNDIGNRCLPSRRVGKNSELISGEGIIEMIRKTQDGYVEEYAIKGGRLIDGDGVWCYQIPMNLDYVQTDEEGNLIPSENPNKGIATRARVRFRFSLDDIDGDGKSRHRAEYLVPNNPIIKKEDVDNSKVNNIHCGIKFDGDDLEKQYDFGSSTQESDFRDLLWNNVYSVKSYIPRVVNGASKKHFLPSLRETKRTFLGIKSVNHSDNNNPFPYNSFMGDLPLTFRLVCNLFDMIVAILRAINKVLSIIHNIDIPIIRKLTRKVKCIGMEIGDLLAFPGCNGKAERDFYSDNGCGTRSCSSSESDIDQYVQEKLAEEFEAIDLDFGNDWINGTLYFPLWHWLKKKKKRFFFGLFSRKAVDRYCSCEYGSKNSFIFHYTHAYNDVTKTSKLTDSSTIKQIEMPFGLIHKHFNRDEVELYYYPSAVIGEKEKMYRLFATDIILLGSLVDNDLNGVGKLFRYLPQTSAHIPPLVQERETDKSQTNSNFVDTQNGMVFPYNSILVSGMDEGKANSGDGLFFGLTCNKLYPNSQGSINAIRACELGVDLDVAHYYPNVVGGSMSYKLSKADALITKVEMYNADIRAEFATYNYNPLIVSKLNKQTGYKTYNYQYMYPHNFDSCMIGKRGLQDETPSQSYLDFRYGKEKHFYEGYNDTNKAPYFGPIYENSFYFYFGLKEGKTAIDKFRNLFYVDCIKEEQLAFNIGVKINEVGSICPNESNDKDYPKFTLDLSSASKPYDLYIKDTFGQTQFTMLNMNEDEVQFSRYFYLKPNYGDLKVGDKTNPISHQLYKVWVKDNNEKTSYTKLDLNINPISTETKASNFKKRYVEVPSTDYADMGSFYIENIVVDGSLTSATISQSSVNVNDLKMYDENGDVIPFNQDGSYTYVMCIKINGKDYVVFSKETDYNNSLTYINGVWFTNKPQEVSLSIAMICNNEDGLMVLDDWQGTIGADIKDYESYKLTLNGFAIPEWVGYGLKKQVNRLFDESKMYMPQNYLMNNGEQSTINYQYWSDVIENYNELPTSGNSRSLAVASYKFGSMFNMCKTLYVTNLLNDSTMVNYDCQSIDAEDYQGAVFYPSGSDDSQQINQTITNYQYAKQNYYYVDANAPIYVCHYVRSIGMNVTLYYFTIKDNTLAIDTNTITIDTRNLIENSNKYYVNKLYQGYTRDKGFYNCFVFSYNTDDKGKIQVVGSSPINSLYNTSTLTFKNWFSHNSYDCRLNTIMFGFQDNDKTELSGYVYGGLYLKTDENHNVISKNNSTTYSYDGEMIKYNSFGDKDLTLYEMKFGDEGIVSLSNPLTKRDLLDANYNVRGITATTYNQIGENSTLRLVNNSFDIELDIDEDDKILGIVNKGNEIEFNYPSLQTKDEEDKTISNYKLTWGNMGSYLLENTGEDHNNIVVENNKLVERLVRIESILADNKNKVSYYGMIVKGSVTLDTIKQLLNNQPTTLSKLNALKGLGNKILDKSAIYAVENVIVNALSITDNYEYFDKGSFDMADTSCFIKITNENVNFNTDKLLLIRRYYNDDWKTTHLNHISYVVSLIPLKDVSADVVDLPYKSINGTIVTKKDNYTYYYFSNTYEFVEIKNGDTFDMNSIADKQQAVDNCFIAENNISGEKIKVRIK